MTGTCQSLTALFGRIFLSAIFLASSFGKIAYWSGTTHHMAEKGMVATSFFLAGALTLEVLGGILVLLGLFARWGGRGVDRVPRWGHPRVPQLLGRGRAGKDEPDAEFHEERGDHGRIVDGGGTRPRRILDRPPPPDSPGGAPGERTGGTPGDGRLAHVSAL